MSKEITHSVFGIAATRDPLPSDSEGARQKLARLAKIASCRRAIAAFPAAKPVGGEPAGSERPTRRRRSSVQQHVPARQRRLIAVAFAILIPAGIVLFALARGTHAPVNGSLTTSSEMPRGTHVEPSADPLPWPLATTPSTSDLPMLVPAEPVSSDAVPSTSRPQRRSSLAPLKPRKPPPDLDDMNGHFTPKPLDAR
jgi:hypothetical protein